MADLDAAKVTNIDKSKENGVNIVELQVESTCAELKRLQTPQGHHVILGLIHEKNCPTTATQVQNFIFEIPLKKGEGKEVVVLGSSETFYVN